MTQDFDPVVFKETTRKQWQNAAAAWHRWTPTLDAWLGPVTEAMLDLAKLKVGDRVLDLRAGAREPSLSAAQRVGPSGHVVATDISSNILEFAAQTQRARGLTVSSPPRSARASAVARLERREPSRERPAHRG